MCRYRYIDIRSRSRHSLSCLLSGKSLPLKQLDLGYTYSWSSFSPLLFRCFFHVSLVPIIGVVGEEKTKPTQHSVQQLRAAGLTPDFLVCRSGRSIYKYIYIYMCKYVCIYICIPEVRRLCQLATCLPE